MIYWVINHKEYIVLDPKTVFDKKKNKKNVLMVSNIAPPFIFGGVINGQFVLLNNKENFKFKILRIRKAFEQVFSMIINVLYSAKYLYFRLNFSVFWKVSRITTSHPTTYHGYMRIQMIKLHQNMHFTLKNSYFYFLNCFWVKKYNFVKLVDQIYLCWSKVCLHQ